VGGEAFSGRVGRYVATAGASGRLRALPLPQIEGHVFRQIQPLLPYDNEAESLALPSLRSGWPA
jgi:hypothetical protein